MYKFVVIALLGVLPCAGQRTFSRSVNEHARNLAPFVVTPPSVVEKMLTAAALQPNETVFDLGSGDGTVLIMAAQKYKVKGVGVEISEPLVRSTNARLQRLNLADQVKVIHGDMMAVDLSPADVVFIYLETKSNEILRPNLEKYLKPGARVVSHDFMVKGWKPARVEQIHAHKRDHMIYVYEMPQRTR